MKNIIAPFNWLTEIDNMKNVDAIDNDFVLLENPIITSSFDYPFKLDAAVGIICMKGTMKGVINMTPYTSQSPCLVIVLPGQILQYEYFSDDFSGLFIVMSKRFTERLNIQEKLPLFFSIHDNPSTPLTEKELEVIVKYYYLLQSAVRIKDNPNRMEIVKHLTMALFYGFGYQHHKSSGDDKKSKQDILVENFLDLIRAHYKKQRGAEFYADKLCLTPKYLSKVIKESSGKSANDWIDDYVVLESKALLKSTNMTIQQISDELNFPSQSFFGKYFKRHVGVSPKEYKKN
jgi:AraC-like DNA-binding protein